MSAEFNFRRSSTEVIVVPAGTFRLSGVVSEAQTVDVPLGGARVEVVAGTGAGLSATTTEDGRYRLYGVSGLAELRVTKDGYQPLARSIDVRDHQNEDFGLPLVQQRVTVSGVYTLRIAASAECREALPEEARVRTYAATLTQDGPNVHARLSGGTFVLLRSGRGNGFQGRLAGDQLTFSLTKYSNTYYKGYGQPYADLAEQISPSRYIVVDGTAVMRASASQMTGSLEGSFQLYKDDPRWSPAKIAECRSGSHQFMLSR